MTVTLHVGLLKSVLRFVGRQLDSTIANSSHVFPKKPLEIHLTLHFGANPSLKQSASKPYKNLQSATITVVVLINLRSDQESEPKRPEYVVYVWCVHGVTECRSGSILKVVDWTSGPKYIYYAPHAVYYFFHAHTAYAPCITELCQVMLLLDCFVYSY